jgi:hypothetical protein
VQGLHSLIGKCEYFGGTCPLNLEGVIKEVSTTIKMEAVCLSEMLIAVYHTGCCYISMFGNLLSWPRHSSSG